MTELELQQQILISALQEALKGLIGMNAYKNTVGKDKHYLELEPKEWQHAIEAISSPIPPVSGILRLAKASLLIDTHSLHCVIYKNNIQPCDCGADDIEDAIASLTPQEIGLLKATGDHE